MELTDRMIREKAKEVGAESGEKARFAFGYGAEWAREVLGDVKNLEECIETLCERTHFELNILIDIKSSKERGALLSRIQAEVDVISFLEARLKLANS